MLGVLSPIFVVDTKTIYGYNFVAPLKARKVSKKTLIQTIIEKPHRQE